MSLFFMSGENTKYYNQFLFNKAYTSQNAVPKLNRNKTDRVKDETLSICDFMGKNLDVNDFVKYLLCSCPLIMLLSSIIKQFSIIIMTHDNPVAVKVSFSGIAY